MREGLFGAVLWVALICVAACGGCGPSRQYVSLSYQPDTEGTSSIGRGPTILSIPAFTDAREGMAPSILGYLDEGDEADAGTLVLAEDASLAETITEEVALLYRLHGFEVTSDSSTAGPQGHLDGELRGEIVTFAIRTTEGGPLGEVKGEGALALELWHPTQEKPIWMATVKASAERQYQWSLSRARSAAAVDIYGQLLRGVERSIPRVEERIEKFYQTGQ